MVTDEQRRYILNAIKNATGDDLERAERTFGNMSGDELSKEWGSSGITYQELLDGYKRERELNLSCTALLTEFLGKSASLPKVLLKQTYLEMGEGRPYVMIYELREGMRQCGWSREMFDAMLKKLACLGEIELVGGDPSSMTSDRIAESYVDELGHDLYSICWREGE